MSYVSLGNLFGTIHLSGTYLVGQLEGASVDSRHGYAFCVRMKLFENLGMFFGHEALDLPDVAEARHHFPVIFDRRFDRIELKDISAVLRRGSVWRAARDFVCCSSGKPTG